MSEIKNSKLGLYGAEHSKCDCMITLGFKGLRKYATNYQQLRYYASAYNGALSTASRLSIWLFRALL